MKQKTPSGSAKFKAFFSNFPGTRIKKFYKAHPKLVLAVGSTLGVVIIALVVLSLTVFKKPVTTTQTVTLTTGNITQSIEIVGSVRAVPSATLSWSTSGTAMPFDIQVGDTVKAGDELIELESSSVSSSILQAQSDLITARNNLALLESADTAYQTASQALASAESTYTSAKTEFNSINEYSAPLETVEAVIEKYFDAREAWWRAQADYEATLNLDENDQKRVDAGIALDEALQAKSEAFTKVNNTMGIYFGNSQEDIYLAYRAAESALNEARISWNAARDKSDDIAAAQANVQALENTINGSRIIAPFDGTITDIFTSVGDHVASGDSAVQLDNLSTMVVDVSVSEVDINSVTVGDNATITFDAIPSKTYQGLVTQVGDAGTTSSGVVRFNVTVTLTDADTSVKPGFTAVTTIITDEARDVVLIPTAAVRTLNNRKIVIVMRDGVPTPVPVTLGASSDIYYALVEGELQAGDQVVITLDSSNSQLGGLMMLGGGFGGLNDRGAPPNDGQRPNLNRDNNTTGGN